MDFSQLLPLRFRKSEPVVNAVRLHGAIGTGTPLRPSLSMKDVNGLLERAFAKKGIAAVALSVNSPGGSAVQSALIHRRIRALAEEHSLPVYVFCEDVAASGGYWLACSGDEIYADESSIVGSIGVIAAGFGFVEAIAKLGIERRVHTSGDNKSVLDPFQPEKKEDIKRLLALQADVHDAFKTLVKSRRAGKLKGEESELFSGAFWSGRQALDHGLIDGIGHLHDVLRQKFGDKVRIRPITAPQGLLRRFGMGIDGGEIAASALDSLEIRALWARFGL